MYNHLRSLKSRVVDCDPWHPTEPLLLMANSLIGGVDSMLAFDFSSELPWVL